MSSSIVVIIVIVVIVVIIAYLLGIIVRRRNDATIASLEDQKQALFDLPVNAEIEGVKSLHLIGQSQTAFREWTQKWTDLTLNAFTDIENHLFEAENSNDTFHFLKTRQEITTVQTKLKDLEDNIASIREALGLLKEQEEKNTARVKHALDLYEQLQETVANSGEAYGPAKGEIEHQLKNIETEFSQFVTLNSSGDPIEASDILDKAEEHTIALGQMTEKIPALVALLTKTLPDQLEDLEQGYQEMLKQHFHFGDENIDNRFSELRASITVSLNEVASLHLDRSDSMNTDIQDKIDGLYHLFEREIKAEKAVKKKVKTIPAFLDHAKENNDKLAQELQRLSKRYLFPDAQALDLQQFTASLKDIEDTVIPVISDLDNQPKPYSELSGDLDTTLSTLAAVEDSQMDVFRDLEGLETAEASARHKANSYVNKLHAIKRYMEKRNLPGIPADFLNTFFNTSHQVEVLIKELDQARIAMEEVQHLLAVATSAMELLEEDAYQEIKNATLAEQLLQYSNRYRSFEPAVQDAYHQALHQFEVDFNYLGAFETISYALETVETGVTDRFVNSYEKTQQRIDF
ncbi:septation ring formation regulator EzrA [Streptococcus sp. DD12]|uniref:septation ring formation regulator EzrA n=1 Tax=Streptococcus sp. DD12 TaxID=1777880 RepID=UPI00079B51DC|nr:septation ring formation regulator EzrA [Streptococcus sp. DD12]KXT76885.1 Septation ring formation regulator EzrA [Streptococcus sp. DD12]